MKFSLMGGTNNGRKVMLKLLCGLFPGIILVYVFLDNRKFRNIVSIVFN